MPLAVDKARYQGEPIALVIADDPYKAADLAELIDVQYEPLKPVRNIDDALRNESLKPGLSRNGLLSLKDENTGVGIAVSTDPSTLRSAEGIKLRIRNGKIVVGLGLSDEG
ncbi:hypothetical protein JCM16161A_01410 [Vulcanisaeta sp. JCM 16161]|uniref:hypothetical protein n=1 Tax=Vulcanisaeta sp. JCM 16161 TaxID=1295372 RepID=UPI0006CFE212|nr:hypothetical protein [Vulcanisaeta sp. JCM 16161]